MPAQIRMVSLLAVIIVAGFLGARILLVPESFGEFGFYRGASVAEIAATPTHYGGEEACTECHAGIDEIKTRSAHVSVRCESCHGPMGEHAANPPENDVEKIADATAQCLLCHKANPSMPPGFKQVDPREHRPGIECVGCHDPHAPEDNEP